MFWKNLLERDFPLAEADADRRHLPLVIDAPDPAPLVEARPPHPLVGLEPLPPVAQRRRLFGLALRLLELPLVLQPLLLRLVLPAQRLLAGLLGVLAQLLQPGQLR